MSKLTSAEKLALGSKMDFRMTINKSLCSNGDAQALLIAAGLHPLNSRSSKLTRDKLYSVHQLAALTLSRVMALEKNTMQGDIPLDVIVRLTSLGQILKIQGNKQTDDWTLIEIINFLNRITSYLDDTVMKQLLVNRMDNKQDEHLVNTFDIIGVLVGRPFRKMDSAVISLQTAMLINTLFVLAVMVTCYCSKCHTKSKCCDVTCCISKCRKNDTNVPNV